MTPQQTSAPATLPADFFSADTADAPTTLPANFFSRQAAPATLPADFFNSHVASPQPAHDPNDRFFAGVQGGEVHVNQPTAWDRITSLFNTKSSEPGLNTTPLTEAIGNAIPQGAVPALAAAKRYAVDPLNRAAEAGGTAGREAGRDLVSSYTLLQHGGDYLSATTPSAYGPKPSVMSQEKLAEQEHPVAMGVAGGVGSVVGSTIADPRNWPLFASSAARPMLQKLMARGFAAQMGAGTYEGAKTLYDNWDRLSPTQRAEIGAQTGVSALLLAKGLAEGGRKAGATETPTHVTHAIDPESPLGHVLVQPAPDVRLADSAAAARDLVERDTVVQPVTESAQARVTGPSDAASFINPAARVVSDSHIPVVSHDEVLAHAISNVINNSSELQNAGIDLSSIKTNRDVDAVLQRASDVVKSNLDPRAEATITFEVQKQLASDLGMSVEDLLSRRAGQSFNTEHALAARALLSQSATHVVTLAKIAAQSGDAASSSAATTALAQHQAIQETVAGITAEAGRALGGFRIDKASLPEVRIANVLSKLSPEAQAEAVRLLSRFDESDPQAVRKLGQFVQKIKPATTLDKLFEYYRNSLLSSPHTIIVKTASEASMVAMETMKKAIAGGIAKFKSSPDRFVSEAYYYAKGMAQALAEHAKPILSGEFQLEGSPGFERAGQQAIKGTLGSIIRTPSEAMSRMTNLLYAGNYFGELNSLAARQAISEALTGLEFNARQELLSHQPTDAMQESAHDLATRNTFQSQLGAFAEKIGQAIGTKPNAAWLPESLKGVAPLKWLFPFYKTPVNLVKATLTHATPLELLNGIAKGDTDALARGVLGSSISAAIAYLAINGTITGGGPTDYKKEETKRSTGWQPYSAKIGGRYVSYKRFEPLGLAMGLIADAVHSNQSGDSEVVAQSKTDTAVKHIMRNLDDLPFMGTLANLLQAVHDPVGGRAQSFINREAGSLIPAGVANIAESLDPTIRRPQTALQAIESRIPGLTSAAPPIVDISGNVVKRPASNLGGANPFEWTSDKHDAVLNELARLSISTPQPPAAIRWKGKQTPLSDSERQAFGISEGQEFYKRVGRLIQSQGWAKRSDDQKRKTLVEIHRVIDEGRAARLTKIRKDSQSELSRRSLPGSSSTP
jgi:hypothetical protein